MIRAGKREITVVCDAAGRPRTHGQRLWHADWHNLDFVPDGSDPLPVAAQPPGAGLRRFVRAIIVDYRKLVQTIDATGNGAVVKLNLIPETLEPGDAKPTRLPPDLLQLDGPYRSVQPYAPAARGGASDLAPTRQGYAAIEADAAKAARRIVKQ